MAVSFPPLADRGHKLSAKLKVKLLKEKNPRLDLIKIGRPPKEPKDPTDVELFDKDGYPRVETQEMRAMRAVYFRLGESRSYKKVADYFSVSESWVTKIAVAFKWQDDLEAREAAIYDEFPEANADLIDKVRSLGVAVMGKIIIDFATDQGLNYDEATKMVDKFATDPSLKLHAPWKDWKDFAALIDAFKKMCFDWKPKPKEYKDAGPLKTAVHIDNANLIIER